MLTKKLKLSIMFVSVLAVGFITFSSFVSQDEGNKVYCQSSSTFSDYCVRDGRSIASCHNTTNADYDNCSK